MPPNTIEQPTVSEPQPVMTQVGQSPAPSSTTTAFKVTIGVLFAFAFSTVAILAPKQYFGYVGILALLKTPVYFSYISEGLGLNALTSLGYTSLFSLILYALLQNKRPGLFSKKTFFLLFVILFLIGTGAATYLENVKLTQIRNDNKEVKAVSEQLNKDTSAAYESLYSIFYQSTYFDLLKGDYSQIKNVEYLDKAIFDFSVATEGFKTIITSESQSISKLDTLLTKLSSETGQQQHIESVNAFVKKRHVLVEEETVANEKGIDFLTSMSALYSWLKNNAGNYQVSTDNTVITFKEKLLEQEFADRAADAKSKGASYFEAKSVLKSNASTTPD